jgi:proliferating cell nuclear antigen
MEATLAEAATFKKVLNSIKDLITETNFDCSASGIALQSMDSSHVCLVSLLLRPDGFESFQCHRPMTLGINLASMTKIMGCSGNDDKFSIICKEGTDVLKFRFESVAVSKISNFELKLMDIQGEALGVPDQDFGAKVTMPSGEFQRLCRDLSVLGDSTKITVAKHKISFSVAGETGNAEIVLDTTKKVADMPDQLKIEFKYGCTSGFALRYLVYFTKATALSEDVVLYLTDDQPLIVQYDIKNLGYIRYYLAPKVDEDTIH